MPADDVEQAAVDLKRTADAAAADLERVAAQVAVRLGEEVGSALDAAAMQVASAVAMVQTETKARKAALADEQANRKRNISAAVVAVVVAGVLATGATLMLMSKAAADRDMASRNRAFENCELLNRANEGNRELWEGILTLASRADAVFPPAEREQRVEDRQKAQVMVSKAFAPEDCSTRRK